MLYRRGTSDRVGKSEGIKVKLTGRGRGGDTSPLTGRSRGDMLPFAQFLMRVEPMRLQSSEPNRQRLSHCMQLGRANLSFPLFVSFELAVLLLCSRAPQGGVLLNC